MSVYQAIVIVQGQSPMDLVRMAVRAGMEIKHQFDPYKSNYVGQQQHRLFDKMFDEWVETGYEQQVYIAESSDVLDEIELNCNMESAPTNFINGKTENKILVVGPFTSERLHFFTQNCTKI